MIGGAYIRPIYDPGTGQNKWKKLKGKVGKRGKKLVKSEYRARNTYLIHIETCGTDILDLLSKNRSQF